MKKISVPETTRNSVIDLCLDTIAKGKQALVFVNTRRGAEKTAEDLARKTVGSEQHEELAKKILGSLERPTKQCERLSRCVKKGIAFHHSGLMSKQRELIEDGFRNGLIKIISATPTLALGVDLPAYRVIIRDLRRYGHRGLDWIPVLEYLQQSGRAGRPRFDKVGESIAIASTKPEKAEIKRRYIKGKPEEIYSKLGVEPVLRIYVLSLVATGFASSKQELLEFFEKTFFGYQYEDIKSIEALIIKILDMLEDFEFIRMHRKDFVSADKIHEKEIKVTLLGRRVSELYIDPLTAKHLIDCLKAASSKPIRPFSFLHAVSSTLEMKPLLRARTREFDKIQEALIEYEEFLLKPEPSLYDAEYEDFMDSIKTALFFKEWADEKSEEYLLEEFHIRPGEIRVKIELADWLLYAMEEFAKLLQFQPLIKEITKLRFRLRYGVKEELLPLLKLKEIGRVRARRLHLNRIKDIGDIKKTDLSILSQILGKQMAIKVKEQVGERFEKKPKKKQISLLDY